MRTILNFGLKSLYFFSLLSDQEREKEDITISSNGNKDSKMEGNDTTHHCVNYTLAPPQFVVPSSSKKGSATGLVVDWLNTFNFFDSKYKEDSFWAISKSKNSCLRVKVQGHDSYCKPILFATTLFLDLPDVNCFRWLW